MQITDRLQLVFGLYRTPRTRPGCKLFCEIRGTVVVGGYHDAPIPWPRLKKAGTHCLVVCGDLVKAVRRESELSVAHHWGVHVHTVQAWRRALGVAKVTDGTRRLTSGIAAGRADDRLDRARRASKTPAAVAKLSASLKGRVQSPATLAAALRASKSPRTEAWKQKMATYWRERGRPPGPPGRRFWEADEDALLGTAPDPQIARRLGRTAKAVNLRRVVLGIPSSILKLSGEQLRTRRTQLALTQEQLSVHAGLYAGAVRAIESGRVQGVERGRAERLASALCCPLVDLLMK